MVRPRCGLIPAGMPLKAGDFLLIPANTRFRVESVSADAVWLALHTDSQLHLET